jgi:xanthine dehydrogenase YagT iron-sulfur-binding subunit
VRLVGNGLLPEGPQEEGEAPSSCGLSRRELLVSSGATGALGALGLLDAEGAGKRRKKGKKGGEAGGGKPGAEPPIPPLPEVCGPGPVKIRFRVNGEFQELAVEPRETLLEVLRDRLGLYGTKEVCDRGQCGACTVQVDGDPVYACGTLALSMHRRQVSTVEGLARGQKGGRPHPLAEAFVAAGALQCGFCTPGFLMASKALLERNAAPGEAEIDQGLCGNLCRCGCYPAIRKAVLAVAAQGMPAEEGESEPPPSELPPEPSEAEPPPAEMSSAPQARPPRTLHPRRVKRGAGAMHG